MGNVGYLVLLMASFGVFLPGFGAGNTALAIGVASVIMWLFHMLILRGVREAAIVNALITIGKVLPLIVFVVIGLLAFKLDVFTHDFWGSEYGFGSGEVLSQIKSMMLVTVWVFIGVEGASVFSERAKSRTDVGRATILGFVSVLALLLAVNILSYGIMSRPELAELSDPSLAGVLQAAVGAWGAKFIALGLIISLLGALLSWFLMAAEIIRVPAQEGLLASSLILPPYLLSALYQLLVAVREPSAGRAVDLIVGVFGSLYGVWLLYAAGRVYLLSTAIFYLLGVPFFVWARREQKAKVFTTVEWGLVALFAAVAVYAVHGLASGARSIQ